MIKTVYTEVLIHKLLTASACRCDDPHAATLFYVPFSTGCMHYEMRKSMSPDAVDIEINRLFHKVRMWLRTVVCERRNVSV
jgi:hypothetical protein